MSTIKKSAAKKPTFKAGQKVKHAAHGEGKIRALLDRRNGLWLEVDFGDKKKPNVKNVRPGTVVKV